MGNHDNAEWYFIKRLARGIAKIASAFNPNDVIVRFSDFKSNEYLLTEWKDDGTSGIKPETIEFRFRSPVSKNQVIVESEDKWAIELTDNGAVDNLGRLQFSISGSSANTFITSSLLSLIHI